MPSPATPAYADTSFLFSLYLRDPNSAAVSAYVLRRRPALALTPWQRCELRNAIRLSVARGNASAGAADQALADMDADIAAGDLVHTPVDWPAAFLVAEDLSAAHTASLAVRTLDLLHVAVAVTLAAKTFLTCDARQLTLARAAGLRTTKI